jgi:alpha-ribazole phosphatase CobZ
MEIFDVFKKHGITVDAITDCALQLYVGSKKSCKKLDMKKIKVDMTNMILSYCNDLNVNLLLQAAFLLEERHGKKRNVKADPAQLVADELIGIAIAEYIGGKNALFNFIRYDRKKPGILKRLGPFVDDAIAGLVAGCMTRYFEVTPKVIRKK